MGSPRCDLLESHRGFPSVGARFETGGDDWNDPRLTFLGKYYPLGSCQMRLCIDQLPKILLLLENVFRILSLHTRYCDSPISARCRSLDQVEIEVVLFAIPDSKSNEMVLEISRLDGDAVSHHAHVLRILTAVRDETLELPPIIDPSWNQETLRKMESVSSHRVCYTNIVESLEIASNMIDSDRYDACLMGLQSLTLITDPNKSGWSTAKFAVERLMRPRFLSPHDRLSMLVLEYALRREGGRSFFYCEGAFVPWNTVLSARNMSRSISYFLPLRLPFLLLTG